MRFKLDSNDEYCTPQKKADARELHDLAFKLSSKLEEFKESYKETFYTNFYEVDEEDFINGLSSTLDDVQSSLYDYIENV